MTPGDDAVPPAPLPKADPESLVLRGRPRPVARFRRGVIIGGVAAVSASFIGLAWLALEPVALRKAVEGSAGRPFEQAAPDILAGAPRDYGDVPRLGPPLPGDLGRPILEQERGVTDFAAKGDSSATVRAPDPALAERQQRLAAEHAARASSLMVQLASRPSAADPVVLQAARESSQVREQAGSIQSAAKSALGDWQRNAVTAYGLSAPASRWEIAAGSVIPASLVTGLNSDLPGMVLAQVTENVRDSATGDAVLIPQGARLIGRYDSGTGSGQTRAFVIWQRIMFPDGSSLRLDNMPASDSGGQAGLSDKVDGHSWQVIKGVVLSSLLGVGGQLGLGRQAGLVRAVREAIQQSGSQAGEQIVSKGLGVQPTITVRPGWPVRVLVSEDLVLPPWRG